MKPPTRFSLASAVALAGATGCGGYRLPATHGVDGEQQVEYGRTRAAMHLKPAVCAGIDAKPDYGTLDETALLAFLKEQRLPVRTERARADLVYVELQLNPDKDEWVRLRVAVLPTAVEAGQELHQAVLQHGKGAWGIHRANLAVLAPGGTPENVLAFVAKTKLACWGVLTIEKSGDAYVVPGGYREL